MATTQNEPVGNGTLRRFPFTFPYIKEDDVKVILRVNNQTKKTVPSSGFTFPSATEIEFSAVTADQWQESTGAPKNGVIVRIFRDTEITNPRAVFYPGSSVKANDLNDNMLQNLYSEQERENFALSAKDGGVVQGDVTLEQAKLIFDGDTINDGDHKTTVTVVDPTDARTITIPDITGTLITTADTGTVVSQMILDGTIVDADINNNADISGSKLLNESVESSKIKNGTIVNEDINASANIDGSKIAAGTIDFDRIKDVDIVVQSEQDQASPAPADTNIFTASAAAKRHDIILTSDGSTPTAPNPGNWQPGKLHYDSTTGSEVLKLWTGSNWVNVSAGVPYTPPTADLVRYVDKTNGSDNNTGILPQAPLATIKKAVELVNAETGNDGHGTTIKVASGVYQETLPISIQKNNVSIVGEALRSVFVQPTAATETNTMFLCDSGTLLANMTFVGLKAKGNSSNTVTRDANGRITTSADRSQTLDPGDSNGAFGLPRNQGWVAAFRSGAVIKKSPYIQNCTNFADSGFDNSSAINQSNLPAHGIGGDTSSACTGGGILCDGSTPASNSPLRSFVVDSFTQVTLDGPGILCTNNGYAQLVSFFGTFCHYHAKSRNGGQLNLSNCTTDFGRLGLIAEGRSGTAIATATVDGAKADGETVIRISETTADNSWHGDSTNPRPLDNMLIEIDGIFYPILSCDPVGGTVTDTNHWDVTVSRPDQNDFTNNLGINGAISNGDAVNIYLRSLISTGGHTFEYVGAGCDYDAHPDNGGVAVEANQVQELKTVTTDEVGGKVWQSSTDHNGKFKVGSTFTVNQQTGQIDIPAAASTAVQKTGATGAAKVPVGTEAQRPSDNDMKGYFRFNDDTDSFEGHDGTAWGSIGGGASAGGAIYENVNTIAADYTITTNSNGMTAGPITINSGVTVTVPSGSTWTIV